MANVNVQNEDTKSNNLEERMLNALRMLPPKEQELKVHLTEYSAGAYAEFINKHMDQGLSKEEATEKLNQKIEEAWAREDQNPQEPTEKDKLLTELFRLRDDLENNAGELDFFSTALDKIVYVEGIHGCSCLSSLIDKQAEGMRKVGKRICEIKEALEKAA